METMLSFDWKSVSVNSAEVIALMRKHRNEKLDVLFHYADGLYRVGVNPENAREPFYMDDETYPSMFAFCSSACIEGGFLLPDLQAPLHILAVNDGDPSAYLHRKCRKSTWKRNRKTSGSPFWLTVCCPV